MASRTSRLNKIQDKDAKARVRKGSRNAKDTILHEEPPQIANYVNKIICGDAGAVLSSMPDKSIDIIITSPPYNFGQAYAEDPHSDTHDWSEYFERLFTVWSECYRVLKPGGRIAVNIQPLYSDYVPTHHIISGQLQEIGFLWKAEFLWEKNNYNAKYTAWGSWCSPSMPYIKYTWEFIEVFDKDTHKKAGKKEAIDIQPSEFKEWVKGRWNIPPETRMKVYQHPAMFPEEVPSRLMKLFSYQGDIVLDPFNGAGTTTVAAWKTDRRFIGIDISNEYCRSALKRLQESGYDAESEVIQHND